MLDIGAVLAETREAPPCGPNLEHDPSFFELEEAARGKRSTDADKPAEDPHWPKVIDLAQAVLLRSKDLRVAVLLTRALTCTEGVPGLATGLGLIHGLLERYWDSIYPQLEADHNNDPTERLSALAPLIDPGVVIKHLRDSYLVNSREHGQLRTREIEVALGRLAPSEKNPGPARTMPQLHAQIAAAFASDRSVPSALREAHERTAAIQALVDDRVGGAQGIDLEPLMRPLACLLETCDTALGARTVEGDGAHGTAEGVARAAGGPGELRTRADAVQMLEMVCRFMEQHEPSNPAPLLIRRAQRLVQMNFLEIVKDLMPDSLSTIEKLAGEIAKSQEVR
jgi:type VI secretion system protein ImpA